LREFKENGVTIIFVTRLDLLPHCSRALLLDRKLGTRNAKELVDHYNRLVSFGEKTDGASVRDRDIAPQQAASKEIEWYGLFRLNPDEERYGTKRAEVLEAGLFTPAYTPVQVLERNREYLIKVKVRHNCSMATAIVSYAIKDPKGVILCGTNTKFQNLKIERMVEGEVITVSFRQVIRLNPGDYLLSVGAAAYEDGEYVVYDRRYDYLCFQVVSSEPRVGLFDAESVVDWSRDV
jgi:teichoic acid transport system ATP-binding protein